jgi:hypothetical protein
MRTRQDETAMPSCLERLAEGLAIQFRAGGKFRGKSLYYLKNPQSRHLAFTIIVVVWCTDNSCGRRARQWVSRWR